MEKLWFSRQIHNQFIIPISLCQALHVYTSFSPRKSLILAILSCRQIYIQGERMRSTHFSSLFCLTWCICWCIFLNYSFYTSNVLFYNMYLKNLRISCRYHRIHITLWLVWGLSRIEFIALSSLTFYYKGGGHK